MLERTIQKAIESAVNNKGQSPELASRIISWLEKLTEGDEKITDKSQYMRRCGLCLDIIKIEDKNERPS